MDDGVCLYLWAVIFTKMCLKRLAHNRIILVLCPVCSKFIQSWGDTVIGKVIARFLLGAAKYHFSGMWYITDYKMTDPALYVVIHYHLLSETDLPMHGCKENSSFPMIHYKSLIVSFTLKNAKHATGRSPVVPSQAQELF